MKKFYSYPLPAQQIKILFVRKEVRTPKDKPSIHGFEVIFSHGDIAHDCFLEQEPKIGNATADLVVKPRFGEKEGLRVDIVSLKQ